MPTFNEIAMELEEAVGMALIKSLSNPHANDLPVRHHVSGKIMAHIPAEEADGCVPVVLNGFVVGYSRTTSKGRAHPLFKAGVLVGWCPARPGEEWVSAFDENGGSFSWLL